MLHARIQYTDGARYERTMGVWSRLAGTPFLDWLDAPRHLRWIDVGCGNGSFTRLLVERCMPCEVIGVDPSAAQLAYADRHPAGGVASFVEGNAFALPFPDNAFDAAVMALVIFFVPDPARGIAEMKRVVRPGGLVSAYAWDMMNDGFPYSAMQAEMSRFGIAPAYPPRPEISEQMALEQAWNAAGFNGVLSHVFVVQRTFDDFEDLWTAACMTASVAPLLAAMPPDDVTELRTRMEARSPADPSGKVTTSARVTAVRGRVPTRLAAMPPGATPHDQTMRPSGGEDLLPRAAMHMTPKATKPARGGLAYLAERVAGGCPPHFLLYGASAIASRFVRAATYHGYYPGLQRVTQPWRQSGRMSCFNRQVPCAEFPVSTTYADNALPPGTVVRVRPSSPTTARRFKPRMNVGRVVNRDPREVACLDVALLRPFGSHARPRLERNDGHAG